MALQLQYTDPKTGVVIPGAYAKFSHMRSFAETVVNLHGKKHHQFQGVIALALFADKAAREKPVTVPNPAYGAASSPLDTPKDRQITGVAPITYIEVNVTEAQWATIEAAEEGDAAIKLAYEIVTAASDFQGATSV